GVARGLPRKSCGSRYIPTYPVLCVGVLADEKHSGRRQTWTNAAPAVRRSYAVAAVKSTRISAFCRVCFCCQGCRACRPFPSSPLPQSLRSEEHTSELQSPDH